MVKKMTRPSMERSRMMRECTVQSTLIIAVRKEKKLIIKIFKDLEESSNDDFISIMVSKSLRFTYITGSKYAITGKSLELELCMRLSRWQNRPVQNLPFRCKKMCGLG
jgi:hypothetical protein